MSSSELNNHDSNLNVKNVVVIGRTGDGKSEFCNRFLAHLGYNEPAPFIASNEATSLTQDIKMVLFRGMDGVWWRIIDTPGLVDTDGVPKDEIHLAKIAETLRNLTYVNLFVLVSNYRNVRFDHAMQDAFKLFCDSFGSGFFKNLVIVFTHVSCWTKYHFMRSVLNSLLY